MLIKLCKCDIFNTKVVNFEDFYLIENNIFHLYKIYKTIYITNFINITYFYQSIQKSYIWPKKSYIWPKKSYILLQKQ